MSNNVFYTIMERDKFVHSNVCCGMTDDISNAIRFNSIDDLKRFMKNLNKDRYFRTVKVNCELKNIKYNY